MKKEFILILGLILSISFVLAIPPSPNAFYGNIDYNGELIQGRCSIEAKFNDFTEQCLIIDSKYGYDHNTCIISDEDNLGGTVEFYLKSIKIGEHAFESMGITKLNFSIDFLPDCPIEEYCGDGICNNGETCSTCSNDCGTCSTGDSGSSGGGGGGGGGGGSYSPTSTTLTTVDNSSGSNIDQLNEEGEEEVVQTETNKGFFSWITGFVIGDGENKGISTFLVILLILLVGIFGYFGWKRYSKR
ncbi:hypothetical protein ACFLZJ_01525 [Nanoarchaeota archaeon]